MQYIGSEFIKKKANFIKEYIGNANAATASKFDANANVTSKNIATLSNELYKDVTIALNRSIVSEKIAELFGEKLAKEYIRQLESHEIYCHDESSLAPYCVSISMYPFLIDGLTKLNGESKAPQHLESFCGSFVNLMFAISSQFAGAVASVEFLMYFDYFAKQDFGEDYLTTHTKIIENHLQHIVYAINQPAAARGYQSVFWNISIFDEYYFDGVFSDFVFPHTFEKPSYDRVKKLQKFFMNWFNTERTKAVLTFPVVTAAVLTKDGKPADTDFAEFCAEQMANGNSFFVYMSDSPDSLASCCFNGDEEIVVNGTAISIKEFVEGYDPNKEYLIESVNPNTLEIETTTIVEVLEKENEYNTLIVIEVNGDTIRVTPDHMLMVKDVDTGNIKEITAGEYAKTPNQCLLPVMPVKFVKATAVYEEPHSGKVYDIGLNKNHYFAANNVVTHNCRLRNQMDTNEFSYSLGAGGVSTGSINVITLNVNRMIQNGANLSEQITKIQKYQIAHRKIFEEYLAAGMLPVYDAGFISMDKQYLTIGINGLVEAAEFKGISPTVNDEYTAFVQDILKTINDLNKEAKSTYGYMFNTEFVPAENLGVKHAKWDAEDGYVVPRDCYNSYFYAVEDQSITALDKMILHGHEMVKYLDGGSALHLNLEEYPSKEGYVKLFNAAARLGCNYWTTNVKVTICNDCETIDKHTNCSCVKCGSKNVDYATRIIGYLKRISNFSMSRQKEESKRYYHHNQ